MSNYMKKGEKLALRDQIRDVDRRVKAFNKTLIAMNLVFHVLKEDDTITEENLVDKIKSISTHNFREEEIEMLKKDLCK